MVTAPTEPAAPDRTRPPVEITSPGTWVRENLFNTWYNTLLTVLFGALIVYGGLRAARFAFVTGRWAIIERNLNNLMVWLWPFRPSTVRPWVAVFLLVATVGFLLGRSTRSAAERIADDPADPELPDRWTGLARAAARLWPFGMLLVVLGLLSGAPAVWALEALLVVVLLASREIGLAFPHRWSRWVPALGGLGLVGAYGTLSWFGGAGWDQWGGLMLTVFVAAGGIVLSFPFGVALALGRRSSFPVVRAVCVTYIETIRGVPLITLLFMGNLMLGLFLPEAISGLDAVTRALVVVTMFTAAYVAEIVRGGLQSVPEGQVEAAQALGLSPTKQTRLIVLPQALRSVIPAMVGQFISLFKDTSLLALISLIELFGASRTITNQGDFVGQGLLAETLIFASLVYWVFCYTMSRESQLLEQRLGVGER